MIGMHIIFKLVLIQILNKFSSFDFTYTKEAIYIPTYPFCYIIHNKINEIKIIQQKFIVAGIAFNFMSFLIILALTCSIYNSIFINKEN